MRMKTLEILIGIPHCGKSKYAEIRKDDNNNIHIIHYIDTDNLDEVITRINMEFNFDDYVILDALNLEKSNRIKIINEVRNHHNIKVMVTVFAIPWITCYDRFVEHNQFAKVPEKDDPTVFIEKFEPPFYNEGIDDIHIIHNSYTEGWESINSLLYKKGVLKLSENGEYEFIDKYKHLLKYVDDIKCANKYDDNMIKILSRAVVCYNNIDLYDYLCSEVGINDNMKIFISNILYSKVSTSVINTDVNLRSIDFLTTCVSIIRNLLEI